MTQKRRRISVIINYFSILLILTIFYIIKLGLLNKAFLTLEIIPLITIIISFRNAFGKTNLWKMTHSSFKNLDEREVQVVYKATSISYSLFVIITLVIIYTFILIGMGNIDALLAAGFLYVAHTLPAAIIAWNEKEV